MFYPINYFKNANHFNEHPTGYLTTADKEYQINFIACDLVKSDDFAFNVVFLTKKEKEVFLKQIKENAVCIRDFEVEDLINKHIVALSTCSYEFDNARTVLFGWLEEVDS
jgi:sortase B